MTTIPKTSYNAGVQDAISVIQQYLSEYPASVFLPPPPGQHGKTVDACSAAALRAVLPHIIQDINILYQYKREVLTCGDCNVQEGMLHTLGCDNEECPFCGGQLLSCNCCYRKLGLYHPHKYKTTSGIPEHEYHHGLSKEQEDKWLSILTSKGRIPFIQYPITCAKCGSLWPTLFLVPNAEWQHYIPPSHQQDVICLDCYTHIQSTLAYTHYPNTTPTILG